MVTVVLSRSGAAMKLACSSSSFARPLAAGELTQLEWLERCASELRLDGVVFDATHFPRTDSEYVAQLKKIAIDLGLVPVALEGSGVLDPGTADEARTAAVDLAASLGAAFLLTRLPAPGEVPPATFVACVSAAKDTVKAAKRVNVTLLIAPAPGTLGSDAAELRHLVKDVDSAWLRYAAPVADFDRGPLGPRDRILLATVGPEVDADRAADVEESARPWLLLEGTPGGEPFAALGERIGALRRAAAKKTLAGASVF